MTRPLTPLTPSSVLTARRHVPAIHAWKCAGRHIGDQHWTSNTAMIPGIWHDGVCASKSRLTSSRHSAHAYPCVRVLLPWGTCGKCGLPGRRPSAGRPMLPRHRQHPFIVKMLKIAHPVYVYAGWLCFPANYAWLATSKLCTCITSSEHRLRVPAALKLASITVLSQR